MLAVETKTLVNTHGCHLEIGNYGATITSLKIPDRNGKNINVVLGLSTPKAYREPAYLEHNLYLGSTIGRYAGRISESKKGLKNGNLSFINGVHLHGGTTGFDKKYWMFQPQEKPESITLSYLSKHLEEGYQGNLKVTAEYTLTQDNEVIIEYTATTDLTTYINLTNHSYFNLNGGGSILNHDLHIASNQYLEIDSKLIPTGKKISTIQTRYNRRKASQLGRADFKGYDQTFILNDAIVKASLFSARSGIKMQVYTNQPAIVVFTPEAVPKLNFKDNATYTRYPAICFETQNFPDAPNHSHFPSALLHPDQVYKNKSSFKFSVVD